MISSILSALANGAIVSVALAAAVWLALRVTPRHQLNAATRYAFWCAVLVATLALPALYLWPVRPADPAPARVAVPASISPVDAQLDVHVVPAHRPAPAVHKPTPLRVRPEWIASCWLLIAAFLLARLAVSWVLLDRRSARAAHFPRGEKWLALCPSPRPGVRVATSTEITIPIAVGPRRPSILIPSRLAGDLADEDLRQIILHEAAHLIRHDDWALLFERIIQALFVFHPAVRWITRQMDLEREVACDDIVLASTGQPRVYASCLARMVELCGGVRTSLAGATAAGDRSHLACRIEMLLDKGRHTGTRPLKTRLTAMIALLAAAVWTVGRTPALVAFAMPLPPAAPPQVAVTPAPEPPPIPAAVNQPAHESAEPQAPAPRPLQAVAGPEQIVVPVNVMDAKGRFVTGLDRSNFRIFDNGVEMQIAQLSTDDAPISAGIVVDTSGSMRNKVESIQAAAMEFLKSARPTDEFFLIPFNDEAALTVPFTSDTHAIENGLQSIQPRGGTALRDAVHLALDQLNLSHNRRKAILIVSDGNDNSSTRSAAELGQELSGSDASIYNINISDGPPPPRESWMTGQATTVASGNLQELRDTAARYASSLRNGYILYCVPTSDSHDGKFHEFKIELVTAVGLPPLKLRYRMGYYAR
ncbi:MAG TPA: VWA domain-containing protein [Bryobacteraceae bacterium]|nr:VWA domain-containing protein [Bryobacteraceae bacterium]